jgi:sugar phosphate isomerase/epimerase
MWKWNCWILLAVLAGAAAADGTAASKWETPLFDGKSLNDWKAGENADSFKVVDGQIVLDGPRAYLFYAGPVPQADFKNFELVLDAMTQPGGRARIFFHTAFQEKGTPRQGLAVQIDNSPSAPGRDRKKTGSLCGSRNQYKSIVADNQWFQLRITVRNHRVQVAVNNTPTVDYSEPAPPKGYAPPGPWLSHGTLALECFGPGSRVFLKNLRIHSLSNDLPSESPAATLDDTAAEILRLGWQGFPVVDYHSHLKGGLTIDELTAHSRETGVFYGVAPNCGRGFPVTNDEGIEQYIQRMAGKPVYLGMQAEGREWVKAFSPEAVAKFDYVFSDAMTLTDLRGKRTRLWMKDEVDMPDPEAFMDHYVKTIVGILENEPIDIYANPTFLPDVIARDYTKLWTRPRMEKVIAAAAANGVAIEINARYHIPSAEFIRLAKSRGVKFSFGTNNTDRNLGRVEYCLQMVQACGLTAADMFVPKPNGQKPVQVRGFKKG